MALSSTEQIPPVTTDGSRDVSSALMEYAEKRIADGIEKYGTPLQTDNGRSALEDARDELFDLLQYIQQLLMEKHAGLHPLAAAKAAMFDMLCEHCGISAQSTPAQVRRIAHHMKERLEWKTE